ncbi:hypothetical protein HGP14_32705 [Rhizobium sp. P32RR-XVIII]|uniref:hypothetical protein n=1 Tax=Rhizobium sp. P32RR-XVIII TaxID=2726738 RepID=UPI0014576B5A|nr:hypothetical protein [Rhizobium sp. P32RR-XVIII]NLS07979.1 hypothetical protein [Rhizobium sp. P32RR-XVIII]
MIRFRFVIVLVVVLAGCNQLGPNLGAHTVASYRCVPSDAASGFPGGASTSGHQAHGLTVRYDAFGQHALLSVAGGEVDTLNLVPGVKGRLYANSKYAWENNEHTNLLTDLAEVQVYRCTRVATEQGVAVRPKVRGVPWL